MENQEQTIDDLLTAVYGYMKDLHRNRRTFSRYRSKWQKLKVFMRDNTIKYYSIDVENAYLTSVLGNFNYTNLHQKEKELVNGIKALTEFQNTGRLRLAGIRKHPPKEFEGEIGCIITDFIAHRENTLKLSENTIKNYFFYMYPFYSHLNSIGIRQACDIKTTDILSYIEQMDPNTQALKHVALNTIKIFFRYLNEHSILSVDYSKIIPKDNYSIQPKLPSTFTDEEIDSLLKAVDRGNPKGKRDYAILLLATKLGLRTSDICELKFANINWQSNVITINQKKTGKMLELPLLPEIGNAIINYLKHGRPVSLESHCFLQIRSPYNRIQTSDLGNLVQKYICLAGINCSNRKHGPHALRHSFASSLLKAKASLPVISEALGHKNLNSSMFYLRIDITSLRECALEVPSIPSSFYEQKGGYFHE
ncbi:MAG TPA: tyrosine-type recombinase/integrase [Bacteroidales bacterium]|nr:tyrosine-type recombinase/integrase [Bacteroidales bacterium]